MSRLFWGNSNYNALQMEDEELKHLIVSNAESFEVLMHNSLIRGSLMLFTTVFFEIVGTLLLKFSLNNPQWFVLAYMSYFISLSLFSVTLRYIPLSIAYVTWCVIGSMGVTILSQHFFEERITVQQWLCMVAIVPFIIGMYIL